MKDVAGLAFSNKTACPHGCGFPAKARHIPAKNPLRRDAASSIKAAGLARSFRLPKRDERRCRDGPLQDRIEREYRWAGGNVGQATSTIVPTPAA